MNEKTLLVVVDPDSVNQPAMTTALQGYEAREIVGGVWFIKTNLQAREFLQKIQGSLGGATPVIISVDRAAIQNGHLPDALTNWFGVTRAA